MTQASDIAPYDLAIIGGGVSQGMAAVDPWNRRTTSKGASTAKLR